MRIRRDELHRIITEEEYQYNHLMKLVRRINQLRIRKDKILQRIKLMRNPSLRIIPKGLKTGTRDK